MRNVYSIVTVCLIMGLAASQADLERFHQHKVVSRRSPAPEPGSENELIPSLVTGLKTKEDWYRKARPAILQHWTKILGKLQPATEDRKWFADPRKAVIREKTEQQGYTRTLLDLPLERDFLQHHLLLMPKGRGPFPAVICWTSTTPDYTAPEEWWGKWLAAHGYVVLTSWSDIRHYRDNSTYNTGAVEKTYDRFGFSPNDTCCLLKLHRLVASNYTPSLFKLHAHLPKLHEASPQVPHRHLKLHTPDNSAGGNLLRDPRRAELRD